MTLHNCRPVYFKFQLSDLTLFSVSVTLQAKTIRLTDKIAPIENLTLPDEGLLAESEGYAIRGLPVARTLPTVSRIEGYVCYVPQQYEHCYIDFNQPFDAYKNKFSSKTRSTINRKVKKYAEHCGGSISWRTYRRPDEMREFFRQALVVSEKTYQKRLLDAGLPSSEEYIRHSESLAADDCIRAYILFDNDRPVSYLYCPVDDGVVVYAYLGYDPEYARMSVGTVLHWLVIEQLYSEGLFQYFDFTEGQSKHKLLFATHHRSCANVFLIRRSVRSLLIVYGHQFMERLSEGLGTLLDRWGLKTVVKRVLRFGAQRKHLITADGS